MNDKDELGSIPSMVPDKDELVHHHDQHKRRQSDIVPPSAYSDIIKVSTWPIRIMIFLIILVLAGGGGLGYYIYEQNLISLQQANRLITDLEGRLAQTGDTIDETTINLLQNFQTNVTQIDRLWATRNRTNEEIREFKNILDRYETANKGRDEVTNNNNQLIEDNKNNLISTDKAANQLLAQLQQVEQMVGNLNTAMAKLDILSTDMENIKVSLNSGDDTMLGVVGRMDDMGSRIIGLQESIRAIDAYRLQINSLLNKIQQDIQSVEARVPGNGP